MARAQCEKCKKFSGRHDVLSEIIFSKHLNKFLRLIFAIIFFYIYNFKVIFLVIIVVSRVAPNI